MEIFGVPSLSVLRDAQRKKLFFDSKGSPRNLTNSKGRKRRPGTKDLSYAIKTTDVAFLDFIRQCLEWDPAQRMTPEQALQHEWITTGQFSRSRGLSRSIHITPSPHPPSSSTATGLHHRHGSHSHINGYAEEDGGESHAVDMKKRLQPVGAEGKPRYSDSSSASTHHHYNGLATKRSSFTSDGLPIVRGSHGTVTLGSRRSSTDAVTMAARDPCLPDGIGNGHVASSKYALPPLV
jgi:serine/threonine protein kinase